jgi:hypothetical protein
VIDLYEPRRMIGHDKPPANHQTAMRTMTPRRKRESGGKTLLTTSSIALTSDRGTLVLSGGNT